jgi:hypothetical protein
MKVWSVKEIEFGDTYFHIIIFNKRTLCQGKKAARCVIRIDSSRIYATCVKLLKITSIQIKQTNKTDKDITAVLVSINAWVVFKYNYFSKQTFILIFFYFMVMVQFFYFSTDFTLL